MGISLFALSQRLLPSFIAESKCVTARVGSNASSLANIITLTASSAMRKASSKASFKVCIVMAGLPGDGVAQLIGSIVNPHIIDPRARNTTIKDMLGCQQLR